MKKTINELEEYISTYSNNTLPHIKKTSNNSECLLLKKTFVGNVFSDFHHHDLYEILYVKTGKVIYSIEEQKYTLLPGDVIFISPSKLHKLNSIESTACERLVINFSEKFIKKLSTKNTNLLLLFKMIDKTKHYRLRIHLNMKEKIDLLYEIMERSQFSSEFGHDIIFTNSFTQLLLLFTEIYEDSDNFEEPEIKNNIAYNINQFINDNIGNKITIEDIAKYVHLSTSRIQHIFKAEMDIPINAYINKKRLTKAKELLRQNEKSVDIYEKCGFQDYTSFFRAFKKEYGTTPKQYAESYKNKYNNH